MGDLAKLEIWDDPAIRGALSWYLEVAENRRPAKFRIAATVATALDPAVSSEDALWAELDGLTPTFLARWHAIRTGGRLPPTADGWNLLELCRELAYRMLSHCNFCPWNCRVDRVAHTGGDGVDAAPRRLPQHQLGRRRGRHPPACHR